MTDRAHRYLDGEMPEDSLTEAERDRAQELRTSTARVVDALSSAPVPDLRASVMARLVDNRPAPAPLATRIVRWLWTPRSLNLAVRPAYAFAGFAALMFAMTFATAGPRGEVTLAPVAATPAVPQLYVQFRLEADDASRVELAGSFTDWAPSYRLEETTEGVWSVMVPLRPGVHDYTFVIDGERWVVDPNAPRVPDSFGGSNSRLFLPRPADAA